MGDDRLTAFAELDLDELLESPPPERFVVADFTADWCTPCRQMEEATWPDADVVQWLQANAIAVQVDIDERDDIAGRFNVKSIPCVVALRDGEEVDRISGAQPPGPFLAWLQGLGAGPSALDRLRADAERGDPHARFRLGAKLSAAGKNAEALDVQLGVWDTASREPEVNALRRSSVAGALRMMAMRFSVAQRALTERRDELAEGLDYGFDADLFADWVTLNDVLGQSERTLEWFDEHGREVGPTDLAPVAGTLHRILVKAERLADVARLYADPLEQVEAGFARIEKLGGGPLADQLLESWRTYVDELVRAYAAADDRTTSDAIARRGTELAPTE